MAKTPSTSPIKAATVAISDAMKTMYLEEFVENEIKVLIPILSTYTATTLERIANHSWNGDSSSLLEDNITDGDWDESIVNDYLISTESFDLFNVPCILSGHFRAWRHNSNLHPANNDGEYPAERLNQFIALHRVTDHMQNAGMDTYVQVENEDGTLDMRPTHTELIEFVLAPEGHKREEVVDTIISHSVYDVDHLKAMLAHPIASLRSGVL